MKRKIISPLSLLLALLLLAGCGKQETYHPDLDMDVTEPQRAYTFQAQPSELLTLSDEGAAAVLAALEQVQAEYPLAYLYGLEEINRRLDFDATVEAHHHSALDEAGELTAAHLTELVTENNKAFLAEKTFGYEDVAQDYLSQVCTLIVETVLTMEERYPDIDWDRVYCNLGSLKILYEPGMLKYAQVSKDMVLSISKTITEILLDLKGEHGLRNVLIHETMHLLQLGCVCEEIENCERRGGFCIYWSDFSLNTADWTWFLEGSAERNMCRLTGDGAISYQYKMDYLCSCTLSVLLREEVRADTMETLCFYSDPQLLFDAFGCETQQDRDEVLKLMVTTNVLQMQPDGFFDAYIEAVGTDPREDSETLNQFSYSLKPDICITLAKEFYENLVPFLQENQVTANDLFFLLTLFESHLNQHLGYVSESKAQINAPFLQNYPLLRQALFQALESGDPDLDLQALYNAYVIASQEGTLNADLSMLPDEKLDFLAERAQWLEEQNGLGVKVPG